MDGNVKLTIQQFKKYHDTLLEKNGKLMEIGRRNARKRKYKEALICFNDALQLSKEIGNESGVFEALNDKATALVDKGSLREALRTYERISNINHKGRVFFDIGYVYGELGEYEKSLNSYEQYLTLHPDDYVALGNIGWTFEQMEQYKKAEEFYRFSLDIKPDYPDTLTRLVILLDDLGLEDDAKSKEAIRIAKKAVKIYDKLIRRGQKVAYLFVDKAIALDVLGEKEKALDVYEKALAIEPFNAFALYNKSCTTALLAEEKKSEKLIKQSLKLLEKAIRAGPEYADLARKDRDFRYLKDNEVFKRLTKPKTIIHT